MRLAVALAAIALLALCWMQRWSAPVTLGNGVALTRDRFTGHLWLVHADRMYRVQPQENNEWGDPPAVD